VPDIFAEMRFVELVIWYTRQIKKLTTLQSRLGQNIFCYDRGWTMPSMAGALHGWCECSYRNALEIIEVDRDWHLAGSIYGVIHD